MSHIPPAPSQEGASFYGRIRFEPALEMAAFRLLAEMDVDGARAAFGLLIDRLDLDGLGEMSREAVLLLLDVLQKVNCRLHRTSTDEVPYLTLRAALIEEFGALEDARAARRAFMPALNRLLARLRAPAASAHPLVERAKTFIDESYQRRLSLSAVAGRLNVSPNYLSRLFGRETGATLTEYIHRTRLEHAKLLLASRDRSISEIAYLVGYQNYRDFHRNFMKYENASPRQVQRRRAPIDENPAGIGRVHEGDAS